MVLVIDTENPESLKALRTVISPLLSELKDELKQEIKELNESREQEDEILVTEEVMKRYRIDNRGTLQRYHREGLRVWPGRPNRYYKSHIDKFIKDHKITHYD